MLPMPLRYALRAGLLATALAAVSAASLADDLSMIPDDAVAPAVRAKIEAVMPKVVSWRRDLHAHPELGNRSF